MKKRIIAFILSALLLLPLASCGEENSGAEESKSSEISTEESTASDNNSQASEDNSKETSEDTSSSEELKGSEDYQQLSKYDELLKKRGVLEQGANSDYVPLNYDKMKAMWISQFDFEKVYCGGQKQMPKSTFKRLATEALDKIKALGFNTVIVQVRPNGDSFYPSEYYPWSHFINGSYGKYAQYDPLELFIDLAHKKGLSFHAWFNPMRAMSVQDAKKLNPQYPIARWTNSKKYERYLFVGEYNKKPSYYLNVYYEEVRQLIIDGVAEIVRYYDVDGVHMDDYFYPGNDTAMDDEELKAEKAKNATMTLKKLRNESLNKLVSGIYSAVKAENPKVIYGIAPAGNINNVRNSHYADVDTWCGNKGYIDYIMPQIYWGFEHSICPFAETYQLWANLCCEDVDYMVGLTFANAIYGYNGEYYDEFIENKDIYKKTYEYMNAQDSFDGFSIFCYQYFYNPVTGQPRIETKQELANSLSALKKIPSKKIEY
ncbi:MAG: family 10 glycosylhydrolase [Clostridia bacterium]|nr:family 10 glycosylhydrolase [Clostridia bacterium]